MILDIYPLKQWIIPVLFLAAIVLIVYRYSKYAKEKKRNGKTKKQ